MLSGLTLSCAVFGKSSSAEARETGGASSVLSSLSSNTFFSTPDFCIDAPTAAGASSKTKASNPEYKPYVAYLIAPITIAKKTHAPTASLVRLS